MGVCVCVGGGMIACESESHEIPVLPSEIAPRITERHRVWLVMPIIAWPDERKNKSTAKQHIW